MEKFTKQFILYFLLSLFITAIIPDVFIHAFAQHEDTVDFHSYAASISYQHIHCDHLFDEIPANQLVGCDNIITPTASFLKIENIFLVSFSLILSETVSLRGPPSIV